MRAAVSVASASSKPLLVALDAAVAGGADGEQELRRADLERGAVGDAGERALEVARRDQVRGGVEHALQAGGHAGQLLAQRGGLVAGVRLLLRRGRPGDA